MKCGQIIEMTTSQPEEIRRLEREWRTRTEGKRPPSVEFLTVDRDRPNTYVVYVQWDSYEDAQKNNALPETHEFATKVAELCDQVTYRNLDVLDERDV